MASNDTLQTIAGVLGNVLEWYGKFTLSVAHMICYYARFMIYAYPYIVFYRFWYLWILQ